VTRSSQARCRHASLLPAGPAASWSSVTSGATRLGWAADHVHTEYFSADVDVTGDVFTVRAAGAASPSPSGQPIASPTCCRQQYRAAALLRAGGVRTCVTPVLEACRITATSISPMRERPATTQMTPCCSRLENPLLSLDIYGRFPPGSCALRSSHGFDPQLPIPISKKRRTDRAAGSAIKAEHGRYGH